MDQRNRTAERLGAHVSVQGGVDKAPVRGKAIGATAIQVFTKTPSQWREPGEADADDAEQVAERGVRPLVTRTLMSEQDARHALIETVLGLVPTS